MNKTLVAVLVSIWLPRIVILALLLWIGLGALATCVNPGEPPSVKDAPWAIQTFSNDDMRVPARVYYAEKLETVNGVSVIAGYWAFNGEKFIKKKGSLAFPEILYGKITIVRRTK